MGNLLAEPVPVDAGRLFLIRHGRTSGNRQRYVGWDDAPLNDAGRDQARRLAALLSAERIDAIYASSLGRARDTAMPLAVARGCLVSARDELREINYGELQGAAKAEYRVRIRHQHRTVPLPGGESLHDVYERVARIAAELGALLAAGRTLAVVGHFWSNRLLAGVLLGLPFEDLPGGLEYKPGNGTVVLLTWPAGAACASGLYPITSAEEAIHE